MRTHMRTAAILAATVALISCGGNEVSDTTVAGAAPAAPAAAITPTADSWATLAGTRIIFGHQSVGRDLLDGLRDLGAEREGVTIVHDRAGVAGDSGLVEFAIGENGKPQTKMADFAAALAPLGDSASGVALFKYCYLDITPQTDVDVLFARHRETVRAIRDRHPDLTFVHVTAPLTVDEPTPKLLIKKLLGKPTARDANAKRTAFNAMLRREYAGEPLFDLERVESTRPDGSRSAVRVDGATVYTLASEYTDDGGHLNATGRKVAAAELVAVLARAAGTR